MHRAVFGALIIYYLIISSLPHYSQFSHYCVQHNTLLLAAGCCALQSQICCVSGGHTGGRRDCPAQARPEDAE